MLAHDAVRSPCRQSIVESFISCSDRLLDRVRNPRIVEARQIAHSIIGSGRHHPRITAVAKHVGESVIVLKNKCGMRAQRSIGRIPVDRRIGKIDVEVRNHRLSLDRHVSRRSKVSLFDVLQIADQGLLRRASRTGIPLDRTLIDHDRECKSGMALRLRHHQLCRLIDGIVLSVPIDNHSIDSAAHHVVNLTFHLRRVRGAVTYVHVVRSSEPQEQMGINFRRRSRIKQGVNVNLAYVSRAPVVIRLSRKAICRTGVVGSLGRQRCRGYNVRRAGQTEGRHSHECDRNQQMLTAHRSSGAEQSRGSCFGSCFGSWTSAGKGTPAFKFPHNWDLSIWDLRSA